MLPDYKYKHVNDTPLMINGQRRPVDDYQPRKQIKVAFTEGKISLQDDEQISAFADKYIVEKHLVIKS